ncbi:MAG: glutaredoxin [Verrucomicrobia bacterium]|nr:glutaredoxin [Verrucomicrobiota bacterium]
MNKPKIIAYLKPSCGWSMGVRAVMKKYDLPFEDRDIINRPDQFEEMVHKTGQTKQPTLEINGQMLPDVSGDEVEAYLLANGLVSPNTKLPDAPTNQPCAWMSARARNAKPTFVWCAARGTSRLSKRIR